MSTSVSSSSVPVTKLVESDVDFAVEFTESVVEFTGEKIVAFPVQFPDNNLERGTGVLGTAVWLVSDCVDALWIEKFDANGIDPWESVFSLLPLE